MTAATQTSYEKTVNTVLFVAILGAGWLPFFYASWREPFANITLLSFAAALAVMAAGLIFDAAERWLGLGKGIYAVAIMCSFPAVGTVISDSALLPMAALLFISAASLWLSVRAQGDDARFMLILLALLLLIAGFFFSFFPVVAILLFPMWFAARNLDQKFRTTALLFVSYIFGAILRTALQLDIPTVVELVTPPQFKTGDIVLLSLPWIVWLLPALFIREAESAWLRAGALIIVLTYGIGLAVSLYPLVIATAAAPVLALITTALLFESFKQKNDSKFLFMLPVVLSAAGFLVLLYARIAEPDWITRPPRNVAVAGLIAAAIAVAFTIRGFVRWVFAGVTLGGFALGALVWTRPTIVEYEPKESSFDLTAILPPLIFVFLLTMRKLYGRRMPRAAMQSGDVYKFSGENIRRFDNVKRADWSGESVAIADKLGNSYSFAIFSDITGAEFPFSTRRGGYFIYRALCRELQSKKPDFAISIGDLSTNADVLPYRRLRQMLRHFPVPLAATPGNHDIYFNGSYRPQFFQSLFGADHSAFTVQGIQFILFNNARGGIDEEQFGWLESVLQSESDLRLVFCHKPIFDPRSNIFHAMENRDHAERLHGIFKKHRVDAVFSGHIHSLMSQEKDGVTYIISGGGGSHLVESETAHHYLRVDIKNDAVHVRATPIKTKKSMTDSAMLDLRFTPKS